MSKPFRDSVVLGIGEVITSEEPLVVHTILGSCIAICMHDPQTKCSGICHAIHASKGPEGDTRHVGACVDVLVRYFQSAGVPLNRVKVKLFGGGNSLNQVVPVSIMRNTIVETSVDLLTREGVRIYTTECGGTCSREIFFNFGNGDAFLRKFGCIASRSVLK